MKAVNSNPNKSYSPPDNAVEWVRNEVGAFSYSQSYGNINVPEHSLSYLVRERNKLKSQVDDLKRCERLLAQWKAAAQLRKEVANRSMTFLRALVDSAAGMDFDDFIRKYGFSPEALMDEVKKFLAH